MGREENETFGLSQEGSKLIHGRDRGGRIEQSNGQARCGFQKKKKERASGMRRKFREEIDPREQKAYW